MNGAADTGPLWLRIILSAIPLVVALVAGAFALATTVKQRTERLKNLADVRNDYPEALNPENALDRLILRELSAIEKATAPSYLRFRRFFVVYVIIGLVGYGYLALGILRSVSCCAAYSPSFLYPHILA